MYWFVPKISIRMTPQTKDRNIAQLNIQPKYFFEKFDDSFGTGFEDVKIMKGRMAEITTIDIRRVLVSDSNGNIVSLAQ